MARIPSRSWIGFAAGVLAGAAIVGTVALATEQPTEYRTTNVYVTATPSPPPEPRATNVILVVGDGMNIDTVTAARILEGQQRGDTGEENVLSFEALPHTGLSKVYAVDAQTPDSAATITALMTGTKTNSGILNLGPGAKRGDCTTVDGNELTTWMSVAEAQGMSTGVVSTASLTDATPAGTYAISPDRGWRRDGEVPGRCAGYPDIASQLLAFGGDGGGLEVALGGGRSYFRTKGNGGDRTDGRDLVDEWTSRGADWAYAASASELASADLDGVDHLLGLFAAGNMAYDHDRRAKKLDQPSLSEMTAVAIDQLERNPRGYALVVESGLIDKAHHVNNAYRALTETIEMSNAVRTAMEHADMSRTVIVVTADHGSTFVFGGYSTRGRDILGLANSRKDQCGRPYTMLGYLTGPAGVGGSKSLGGPVACGRPSLRGVDTTAPSFRQQALVTMQGEAHSGADVPVYAIGPGSDVFSSTREESYFGEQLMAIVRATGAS